MKKRRVVVTGYGAVSSIGSGDSFKKNMLNGVSGIGRITRFDTSYFRTKVAGEVREFNPREYFSDLLVDNTPLFGQYALRAAQLAMDMSGLVIDDSNRADIGVYAGSAMMAVETVEALSAFMNDQNIKILKRGSGAKAIHQAAAIVLNKYFGTMGPCMTVTTACSSAMNALNNAYRDIFLGNTRAAIVGGSDTFAKYSMYLLARESGMSVWEGDPSEASRPFDRDSAGWVISEGGAYLVLEEAENARNRGAKILGEIKGMGASCDITMLLETDETGEGFSIAIGRALKDAELAAEEIEFVNAHGPGIPAADRCEANALKIIFNESYCKIPVTSIKSIIGNPSAAAGIFQVISTLITFEEGVIPPTINFSAPLEGCEALNIITSPIKAKIQTALVNCHAADGTNASAVMRKWMN